MGYDIDPEEFRTTVGEPALMVEGTTISDILDHDEIGTTIAEGLHTDDMELQLLRRA